MTASDIIKELGGITTVSQHLGWPTSTVGSWVQSNTIPDWRQPALLRMALDLGKPLSTADFPSRRAKAA